MRKPYLIRIKRPPIAEVIRLNDSSMAFARHDAPRFELYWHSHPELEFTFITEGTGTRFVGDSVESFSDGDLVFLGRNLPHSWVTPRRVKSLVIQFLPEFLGETFLSLPEARRLQALFERARRGMFLQGRTRERVAELMQRMNTAPAKSLQLIGGLLEILDTLTDTHEYRALAIAPFEPSRARGGPERVNTVLHHISRDPQEIPSQNAMAELVRLSPQAFSRFFKHNLGKTYVEYVNEFRISRACRALMETEKSITEIAFECGFNNLSNFNLQFRRLKRTTPRAWRTLIRKQTAGSS